MKLRFMLGFFVIASALFIGLTAAPAEAHAATGVTLSPAEQSRLQAVLGITKLTLDAIQLQMSRGEVRDPAMMAATLGSLRTELLRTQSFLGGQTAAGAPSGTTSARPSAPSGNSADSGADPAGDVSGTGTAEDEEQPVASDSPAEEPSDSPSVAGGVDDDRTASVSSSVTSRWAFWTVLIAAVALAVILAIPRKHEEPLAEAPAPPSAEENKAS